MATAISANKAELLAIADSVAKEKLIDREIVIEAMEDAIQRAAKTRYGAENDIRAKIDPKGGELRLWRVVEVVEEVENYFTQVSVADGEKLQKGAAIGDYIVDPLPAIEFGRIQAQASKQIIFQKVRDAERERQYGEFKDRVGRDHHRRRQARRVRPCRRRPGPRRGRHPPRRADPARSRPRRRSHPLADPQGRARGAGPQIFLSRAHPDFMKKLFAQEVPEIYDGVITIMAAARDPGSRAKIGVISRDSSIDPVGACVGMKGSRVQAVVQEMQGEKIDIIPWSPDAATFVVNALQPANVARVVIDEDDERIEVVVPDDQLVARDRPPRPERPPRLQLTGKAIDILTEADASREAPEGIRRAHRDCSRASSTSTRRSRSCSSPRASAASRRSPMSIRPSSR